MPSVNLTIQRANDFDDSYEVWMKKGGVPLEYGDGLYVGNYPIKPWETFLTIAVITPPGTSWGFSATAVQQRELGLTGTVLP